MTVIHHPEHLLDRVAMAGLHLLVSSMKGSIPSPSARKSFDDLMEKIPAASGVTYEPAEMGSVPGWWCLPENAAPEAAILYFHGGAYVMGSALAYKHFVGQIAARAKVAAFVPEYGLAPERPFPVAVHDAQTAYQGLVGKGFARIALAGDSAGGGLALVLLSLAVARARETGGPAPVGAVLMSPWTDLALTGAGMQARATIAKTKVLMLSSSSRNLRKARPPRTPTQPLKLRHFGASSVRHASTLAGLLERGGHAWPRRCPI
jgi:epsilon-lactone hydrolase